MTAGWGEIRSALQRFLDAGFALSLKDSVAFKVDDTALPHWSWIAIGPDGDSVDGIGAEVLRRQADGRWRFIIDNSDIAVMLDA